MYDVSIDRNEIISPGTRIRGYKLTICSLLTFVSMLSYTCALALFVNTLFEVDVR